MPESGKWRLVAEGLLDPGDDETPPALLGARCELCGEVLFPPLADCPACTTYATMRPFRIRGAGRLRDVIVVRRGPSGFAVPYVQGYIELDDGPIVYSLIDAPPAEDSLRVGERMTMTVAPLRYEDDVAVLGWKFRPVEGGEDAA